MDSLAAQKQALLGDLRIAARRLLPQEENVEALEGDTNSFTAVSGKRFINASWQKDRFIVDWEVLLADLEAIDVVWDNGFLMQYPAVKLILRDREGILYAPRLDDFESGSTDAFLDVVSIFSGAPFAPPTVFPPNHSKLQNKTYSLLFYGRKPIKWPYICPGCLAELGDAACLHEVIIAPGTFKKSQEHLTSRSAPCKFRIGYCVACYKQFFPEKHGLFSRPPAAPVGEFAYDGIRAVVLKIQHAEYARQVAVVNRCPPSFILSDE